MTTTHTGTPEGQVLVVGAGPTGLTLAAQLLARGIHARVIDKGAGPASQSRALSIQARTLELLDTMGLAEAFVDHGHRVRRLRWYASQRNLCDLDLARNGSRYGFVLDLPQSRTETLLRARVQELGGTIEQRVELVHLAERGGAVDTTLRDAAGREIAVSVGYVVGCDGAHSRVRHEIGLPFEGQPYPQDWLLADVALDGAGSDGAVHAFFRPNGLPLVCIPMGGQRWRVVMANAGDRGGQPPTFAEIQELVAERAPRPIEVSDPQWLASFRCHLRSTSSYRRGRVLLAGDAAHIHSPAGGQGMNTGMMDAHNLAWKLALVADGRAPDALLDTYGQERIPVASGVLEFTNKLVGLLTMRNRAKRVVRDTVVPVVSRTPMVQRDASRKMSQLSVAYPRSPLVQPDGHRRGPKPGDRFPDVDVRGEHGPARLHHLLGNGRHVLIVSRAGVRSALETSGIGHYAGLVDIVEGDPGSGFALVRPDGILAARGSAGDTYRVVDYLSRLCGLGEPGQAAPAVLSEVAAVGRPALIRDCGSYLAVVWSICYLAYALHVQSWHEGRSQEYAVAAETAGFPAAGPATATRCRFVSIGHGARLPGRAGLAANLKARAGAEDRGGRVDSAKIRELDARYLASVLKVRFFPLIIERAEGCRITDAEGVTRLDFTAGWAVANLGYNNARLREAVAGQFARTSFGTLTAMMSEQSVQLAERLTTLFPGEFDKKVWFGLHGSDANDCLAKLVPLATGRRRMISFIGGYHGQTAGAAALSGHTAQAKAGAGGNVIKIPYPDPYRPVLGYDRDPGDAVLDYLENYILRTICPPEDTAGIIVEPVQSDGGDIVPPPRFLKGIETICRKHGIMLLIDEVKIGFGRSGHMFAFEHFGVVPDAVSLGKSMGSGMPISAVVGRRELLDVAPAINMYTMAGNPVACAAALANLDEIDRLGLVAQAGRTGGYLLDRLRGLQQRHTLIGDVRGLGMMLGLETVRDRETKEPADREMAKIVMRAFELGLVVFYGGIYSNVMEITPPLIITPAEVDEGVAILDQAIGDVEAGEVSDEALGEYAGW